MSRGHLKLFSNRSGNYFAEKLSKELDTPISKLETIIFADGERKVEIKDSVRGCDTYIVQSCFDPTSKRSIYDNFFELLITGDALKRSGASDLTAVLPYHPFTRQDKRSSREPLTARLAASLIETSGFGNVITAELHAEQIVGFYKDATIENLPGAGTIISSFKEAYPNLNGNLVVISPDAGGAKRAEYFARKLDVKAAQAFKKRFREEANEVEDIRIVGNVKDHNILVVDDMVDTGGSIAILVDKLREIGVDEIKVCCTHALLNGKALPRIKERGIEVIATDTIPRTDEFKKENSWYKEISIAPLFAKVIKNLNENKSVSELYEEYS